MSRSRFPLWFAAIFSLLIALPSYRFFALGLPLSFPEMHGHIEDIRLAFLLHVSLAPVALVIGSVQFFPAIRRRTSLHRFLGRVYGVAILVSGTAGLIVALNAAGGFSAQLGFSALALVWVATTAYAVWQAIQRRIGQHRRWMVYSFALTFSGVTLRLYLIGFAMAGFSYTEASIYLAWMCWLPNLAFARWWLARRKSS